jgi:hypothetical protein
MSGWGQVLNTDPDYVLDISRPPRRPHSQRATSCRNPGSERSPCWPGCIAVDVRPAGAVWVGTDVERYLGLVESNVHIGVSDQFPDGVEDAVGAAEKLKQRRGFGGPLPVEVVTGVSPWRGALVRS